LTGTCSLSVVPSPKEADMLERLASLASIISALAIVASVVYASIQIRHSTRAVTASAFQQVVNSFAEISFEIAKDRNVAELYVRGSRDFPALDEVERARFSLMLLSFLRRAENVLFQSRTHVLTGEHWSGIRSSIKAILSPPGARACWNQIQDRLNPEFRSFVASLIAE
jgi:hypothetical protein